MTTHVFIVDHDTFKCHLEYLFVGTGAGEKIIDFNNSETTIEYAGKKHKGESGLLGMIADNQRMRIGDNVIFYLLQKKSKNKMLGGKFYGVFRIREIPSFLDHNDDQQYLKNQLNKSLTFRTLIEPHIVYPKGITEWEALDEIRNIQTPDQMIWSLIYRKLKADRGNTMITIYESQRLIELISNKNNGFALESQHFFFDVASEEIMISDVVNDYTGRQEVINILPRLVGKFRNGLQFEPHLQVYILQNLESISIFQREQIDWIGNEVSCGVGMQSIDIMLSVLRNNQRTCIPIELKSTVAYQGINNQLQRYIDWINQYYIPNIPCEIEPMIISRKINDKNSQFYTDLIGEFENFNERNNISKLRYVEFNVNAANQTINFEEINY